MQALLGMPASFALLSISIAPGMEMTTLMGPNPDPVLYVLEESVFGKGKVHQLAPCPDHFFVFQENRQNSRCRRLPLQLRQCSRYS